MTYKVDYTDVTQLKLQKIKKDDITLHYIDIQCIAEYYHLIFLFLEF